MELKISKISKHFGSVKANKNISLKIESKKIHALLGENGAGKSTLVKIISGHYKPDSGEIYVDKNKLELGENLKEARERTLKNLENISEKRTLKNFLMNHLKNTKSN